MEEATFLTRFANSVTVVHRRDDFRASAIMLERARRDEKIRWATNSQVVGVNGDTTVSSLTLADTNTGERRQLPATGLFLAIGHDPRSALFAAPDRHGRRRLRPRRPQRRRGGRQPRTSLAGVFACGDLVDHTYRQAITAAGTGCAAALDAQHYLASTLHLTTDPDPGRPVASRRGRPVGVVG